MGSRKSENNVIRLRVGTAVNRDFLPVICEQERK